MPKRSRSGSKRPRSITASSRKPYQRYRRAAYVNRKRSYKKATPRQGPDGVRVTDSAVYSVAVNSGLFGKVHHGVLSASQSFNISNVVTNTAVGMYFPLGGFTFAAAGTNPGYSNLTLLGSVFQQAMVWKVDVCITASCTTDTAKLYILAQRSNANSLTSTFVDSIAQNDLSERDGCVTMELSVLQPRTFKYSYYPWKVLGVPASQWRMNVNPGVCLPFYTGLGVSVDSVPANNVCPVLGITSAAMSQGAVGVVEVYVSFKAHYKAWDPVLETGS